MSRVGAFWLAVAVLLAIGAPMYYRFEFQAAPELVHDRGDHPLSTEDSAPAESVTSNSFAPLPDAAIRGPSPKLIATEPGSVDDGAPNNIGRDLDANAIEFALEDEPSPRALGPDLDANSLYYEDPFLGEPENVGEDLTVEQDTGFSAADSAQPQNIGEDRMVEMDLYPPPYEGEPRDFGLDMTVESPEG